MASRFHSLLVLFVISLASFMIPTTEATLTPDFYEKVCPEALPVIRSVVQQAINREPRMGASLLRLHFHDCFVNGCDGSVLLDDTANFIGEKTAFPNNNSLRGFDVVDEIKAAVDDVCKGPVVSCADILAIAAHDSVTILGGPLFEYQVFLGRRDSRTASRDAANTNIPAPFFSFSQLLSNFQSHGLNLKDLVVLSGGHTIGFARCTAFRDRIYNDTDIDPQFAVSLRQICPRNGGDNNLAPLDSTPTRVDTTYYEALLYQKGLLHSDQELFKGDGSHTDELVKNYSYNRVAFAKDFGVSMVKMGNMEPLTGDQGEIRCNCRSVN